MKKERFEWLMNAVDDDLLEEAQRPVKAKRPWMTLAVSAAACLAVIAAATLLPPVTEEPNGPAMVVNPMQAVTAAEVEELGYCLPVPAEAGEAAYYLIDRGTAQGAPLAEVRFEQDGAEYTCRALKTGAAEDISGLYTDWIRSVTWVVDAIVIQLMEAEDDTACVSWYAEDAGVQWCLSGDRGAPALLNTARAIMNTLGYDLNGVPQGAEETEFRALTQERLTIGETTFVLDGVSYAYRVAATDTVEEEFEDISGIAREFTEECEGEIGWCSARLCFDEGGEGKILWFDAAPGLLYSLYMETGASEEALLHMAHTLYDPAQDDAG